MWFRNLSLVLCIVALAESEINETDSTIVTLLFIANDIEGLAVSDVAFAGTDHGRIASLDLSDRGIYRLIPQMDQLDSLSSLDLSHNDLTHLDAELWKINALTILDVSYNELTTFPDSMVNLQLGYSLQDEEGYLHIVMGLYVDSNRLCGLDPPIDHWISDNTSAIGQSIWRNTQGCESHVRRPTDFSRGKMYSLNRTRGFQIWDLRGRAVRFRSAAGNRRNWGSQFIVVKSHGNRKAANSPNIPLIR